MTSRDILWGGRDGRKMDALLSLADPRIYQANAFCVTGLPVDATDRELSRQLEKQRMAQKLHVKGDDIGRLFPSPEPPSPDAIREAAHHLKDPQTRLLHEIFWFWPLSGRTWRDDPALERLRQGDPNGAVKIWTAIENDPGSGVVGKHNLAVLYHRLALIQVASLVSAPPTQDGYERLKATWQYAILQWAQLLRSDTLWARIRARIRAIDDPRVTPAFALDLQSALPVAICLIGAKAAVAFAQHGVVSRAAPIVSVLRSEFHPAVAAQAFQAAVAPSLEAIKALCGAAEEEAKRGPEHGDRITQNLLAEAKRSLDAVAVLFEPGAPAHNGPFDQVALCGMACMIPFANTTERWEAAVPITEQLLTLAASESSKDHIRTNLEAARRNLEQQRLQTVLGPVVDLIETILKDPSPVTKLSRLKAEAWPRMAALQQQAGVSREDVELVATRLGWAFRVVGVDLFNDLHNWNLSSEAINLAIQLAFSEQLRAKLRDDRLALDRQKPKSQCFIATAAFGSETASEVATLRLYRDTVLTRSSFGRAFVRIYYCLSPRIARTLEGSPRGKVVARSVLMPLVRWCRSVLVRRGADGAVGELSTKPGGNSHV